MTLQSPLPPYVAFPAAYCDTFSQADFTFSNGFSTMKDRLHMPYVQSWNVGVQREIGSKTVVEARYLGNRGSHVWRTYSLNEVNIFENGFLQEFKNAQRNLAINVANARTGFANNGLPGQVPLPIFEAAFGARGSQAALPAGSAFTNAAFITNLQQGTAGALARDTLLPLGVQPPPSEPGSKVLLADRAEPSRSEDPIDALADVEAVALFLDLLRRVERLVVAQAPLPLTSGAMRLGSDGGRLAHRAPMSVG